jgi:DNA invertase Pin-like site-specific DNA recombinase
MKTDTKLINVSSRLSSQANKLFPTVGEHSKLLLAIYSYFAEAERSFISIRTKQGLAAVKAKGIKLGRPKGRKNKFGNVLLPYRDQIQKYLEFRLSLSAIQKLINPLLQKPISY